MLLPHIRTNMSILSTPLGMNVVNNPLVDSPFVNQHNFDIDYPPTGSYKMLTETEDTMITEDNNTMVTE